MVSKKFLFGMLAITLVFGMAVIGCEPEVNTDPKTITITGIPDTYNGSTASLEALGSALDKGDNWYAFGEIVNHSGNSATFLLYIDYNWEVRFTGYGDYALMLSFQGDNINKNFMYTNGKTFGQEGDTIKLPKYSIDKARSSIPLSKFQDTDELPSNN